MILLLRLAQPMSASWNSICYLLLIDHFHIKREIFRLETPHGQIVDTARPRPVQCWYG